MPNQDHNSNKDPKKWNRIILESVIQEACKLGKVFNGDPEIVRYLKESDVPEELCESQYENERLALYVRHGIWRTQSHDRTAGASSPPPTPPPESFRDGDHSVTSNSHQRNQKTYIIESIGKSAMNMSMIPQGEFAWVGVIARMCRQDSNYISIRILKRWSLQAAVGSEVTFSWWIRKIDEKSRISRFTVVPDDALQADVAIGARYNETLEESTPVAVEPAPVTVEVASEDELRENDVSLARGQKADLVQPQIEGIIGQPQMASLDELARGVAAIAAATAAAVTEKSSEAFLAAANMPRSTGPNREDGLLLPRRELPLAGQKRSAAGPTSPRPSKRTAPK